MATTTTDDGVEIAYDVTGDGPPLVLVHGITESRRAWDPLVPSLAEHHTVVAVDMRGHGESGPGASYDPMAMAADVAAVVAHVDLGRPVVVGHSMGGIVVTAYAAAHPCRGVINVDQSIALGEFQEMVRGAEPLLRSDAFDGLMADLFAGLSGPLQPEEVERLTALRRPSPEVVLGVWGPLLELDPAELDGLVATLTATIDVPYLAIHGHDPGPDYGRWLDHVIPTARLEVWEDSGHYPHLVHQARFVERVAGFERSLA